MGDIFAFEIEFREKRGRCLCYVAAQRNGIIPITQSLMGIDQDVYRNFVFSDDTEEEESSVTEVVLESRENEESKELKPQENK